jgi:two-component system, chemotaxis family, CheB/CheR fusion protein
MHVTQVTETTIVKPDHVYVIPPDKHLNMVDGKLKVIDNRNVEDRRAPVDIFFRTLADSHQQRAIAVFYQAPALTAPWV